MNTFEAKLHENVHHYPDLNDCHVSHLSMTAGFSPCLQVWPFWTANTEHISLKMFSDDRHTNYFVSSKLHPCLNGEGGRE